jgi:hypothetical protein
MPWIRAGLSLLLLGPRSDPRPRVIVSSDIGGTDPDDCQSIRQGLAVRDSQRLPRA